MKDLTHEIFEESGVDSTRRPTQLSIKDFNHMCHAYSAICDRIPGIIDYDYR